MAKRTSFSFHATIIHKYGWLLVLLLGLMLRVGGNQLNPIGLAHDEIHDIINAKSIALTGTGVPGTVAGILPSSGYCDGNCVFGELGTIILAPWMKLAPMNLGWVKIPFLAASLLIIWWTGKLWGNLTSSAAVGKLAGLLVAISPWAILFGRTAYENLFAYAFFMGSLYWWTKKNANNKDALTATILGLLGSGSYFGAKVLWPPLMILGAVYWWLANNKPKKSAAGWIMINLMLVVGYGLVLINSPAGVRMKELNATNGKTAEIVNEERRMSLEMPFDLDRAVSNKMVTIIRTVGMKYLNVFSAKYFLSDSEGAYDNFSIPGHGYVYLIEFCLAVLGTAVMYRISRGSWLMMMGILAIVPIAGALNNYAVTYALRAGMIFPMMSGLAAAGWYGLYKITKEKRMVLWGVGIILLVSLAYFEILYWYRLPFEKSAGYVFHERAMITYVNRLRQDSKRPIELTVNDPVDVMYNFGFYSGKYNNKTWAEDFNKSIQSGSYEIEGIKFSRKCPVFANKETIYIWERDRDCVDEPNKLARISEPRDGGARFFIPTDFVCQGEKLKSYPNPRTISDFNIEKMTTQEFCQKWISKPL